METKYIVLFSVISYLLGSIPTSIWVGKGFFGIDVRGHGSGNAGATNTLRTLGSKAGFFVLLVDLLKGFSAANLILFTYWTDVPLERGTEFRNIQVLFGVLAVVGHIFPLFARFKGGKGIATLFGLVLAIDYPLALMCVGTFLLVLLLTRYVSLASMLAVGLSPLFVGILFDWNEPVFTGFCIAASILVLYTHKKNIRRLANGEENKFTLPRKSAV